MDKIKIGKYLKELRLKKKRDFDGKTFTQNDLVNAFYDKGIEVSINAINEWETGNSIPSPEKLEFLAEIYEKTIDEILEGEDNIEIDFMKEYFIANKNWASEFPNSNIFSMNQRQILKIYNRFRELSKKVINKPLSLNEENEYRFLFEHFYTLTDYHTDYCKINANNDYLRFRAAINQMRSVVRNLTDKEKYWEIQKLYSEKDDNNFRFSHWRNMDDLIISEEKNPDMLYIKNRYEALDDWQKDMFLAMFQNIEGYDRNPNKWGSDYLKRYEDENGEYDHDKRIKDQIRYLINHGALYNKFFLNFKQKETGERRIIDKLEKLYDSCLKPIEIEIKNQETNKWEIIKLENTQKNRFINFYYHRLSYVLKYKENTDSSYSDLQQVYDYFINHEQIDDETRLRLAKLEKIDTDREKKYWMADYNQRLSHIEKEYSEFKEKEKQIHKDLKEIKKLEEMLMQGKKTYQYEYVEVIGGNDERTIREYIECWKSQIDYKEFLKYRDHKKTKELLKDLDILSLQEIKEKYFAMEVVEGE